MRLTIMVILGLFIPALASADEPRGPCEFLRVNPTLFKLGKNGLFIEKDRSGYSIENFEANKIKIRSLVARGHLFTGVDYEIQLDAPRSASGRVTKITESKSGFQVNGERVWNLHYVPGPHSGTGTCRVDEYYENGKLVASAKACRDLLKALNELNAHHSKIDLGFWKKVKDLAVSTSLHPSVVGAAYGSELKGALPGQEQFRFDACSENGKFSKLTKRSDFCEGLDKLMNEFRQEHMKADEQFVATANSTAKGTGVPIDTKNLLHVLTAKPKWQDSAKDAKNGWYKEACGHDGIFESASNDSLWSQDSSAAPPAAAQPPSTNGKGPAPK